MRFLLQWLFILILCLPALVFADNKEDIQFFENIFSKWTEAFNHKDLATSCLLFSKDVKANYQGFPSKNYDAICDGFKKIFNERRNYHYAFKLHDIYRSDNLAAVRVTWYLQIMDRNKLISNSQDEGLDVFVKNSQGGWQIVSYLAYPIRV